MIPVFDTNIDKKDIESVVGALKRGELSGNYGKALVDFEKACADYHHVKYASAVNSGSSALLLAVASLGIGRGDEVILSTFTNIATCLAVTHNGATPVVVDSQPDTWNMDVSQIEDKINKKTKAIMPVHIYGHPVDMDPVLRIAKKYNLFVIEDSAEAQGAEYKERKVGCFGTVGCLSFYGNKTITTGEGGMVITNNEKVIDKVNLLKNLSFEKPRFLHWYAGYNFRMPNITAALGVTQMERIETTVKIKRQIAAWYIKYLKGIPGIQLPVERDWAKNVYWMFGIVIDPAEFGRTRDQIMEKLLEMGIETRTFFIPMNLQPVFHKMGYFRGVSCPVAEQLSRNGFYLPSGYNLSEEQIAGICTKLISLRRD